MSWLSTRVIVEASAAAPPSTGDYSFHYGRADGIPEGVAVFYQYANGAAAV